MKPALIVIIILVVVIGIFAARNIYELHHLNIVNYRLTSKKVSPENSLKAVFLTDLHGRRYGENNRTLLKLVAKQKPDVILTGGDMVTASDRTDFPESIQLFQDLMKIAPVYSIPGNHEKRMNQPGEPTHRAFLAYKEELIENGVNYMENDSVSLNSQITLSGLDIDPTYYNKIRRNFYLPEQMKKDLAEVDRTRFNIVLAHNPRFFSTYAGSGADLFLAGHYHGGAVRIGKHVGVVSPQFVPFPKYTRGMYKKDDTAMIVSAGCGSHKVNLRLFNQPEIVVLEIHGNLV
ncbi:MAG: metallophosphoesterase [Parasporobacterium sp.]|nr:metallophosphoesterase [Parasporobacterium sp.]